MMWIHEGTVSRPGSFSIFSPFQACHWSALIVAAFLWSFNYHLLLRGLLSSAKNGWFSRWARHPISQFTNKNGWDQKSDPTNSSKREEIKKGFRMWLYFVHVSDVSCCFVWFLTRLSNPLKGSYSPTLIYIQLHIHVYMNTAYISIYSLWSFEVCFCLKGQLDWKSYGELDSPVARDPHEGSAASNPRWHGAD